MKNTGKSKIWKNVLVASSTFVVGAAAAIGITYAVVHKDPIADKLLISGSNTIQTFVNYNGEEDYQATDKISGEFVKGQWSLDGSDKDYFNIDNQGALTWTSSALSETRTYNIKITCICDDLQSSKDVSIQNNEDPLPPFTSISVYGSTTLTGENSIEGYTNYVAVDNNGHKIIGGNWTIENKTGSATLSINSDGTISWNASVDGTTTFKVKCVSGTIFGLSDTITLTINSATPPVATSIDVWGSQELTGVGGFAGLSDYTATDNNGHILAGCSWSIQAGATAKGINITQSGQVTWNSTAESGTFTIMCQKTGLSDGTLLINITINNPQPTPGPMPVSCLEISNDGKICYGLKASVDLSLYNEIDIPESVETIEINAFDSKISSGYQYSLNLPNSLINIQDNAFNNCIGMEELNLGNSVQSIGANAFNGLSRVKKLSIPDSVISFGKKAFANMMDVVDLSDLSSSTTAPNDIFSNSQNFTHLSISSTQMACFSYLFSSPSGWANPVTLEIFVVNGVATFPNVAGHSIGANVQTLIIHDGITDIGDVYIDGYHVTGTFEGWRMKKVVLPNSLLSLKERAFFNNNLLTNINLCVPSIAINSLSGCDSLSKIDFLNSAISVANISFENCKGVRMLDFSKTSSVVYIAGYDQPPVYYSRPFLNDDKIDEINLGSLYAEPNWTILPTEANKLVLTDVAPTGNVIVNGSWTTKSTVLTFLHQWGLPNTGWTVNGE